MVVYCTFICTVKYCIVSRYHASEGSLSFYESTGMFLLSILSYKLTVNAFLFFLKLTILWHFLEKRLPLFYVMIKQNVKLQILRKAAWSAVSSNL